MTREEAIQQLKDLRIDPDPEKAHAIADEILCDLLIALGYEDVVSEWRKIEKWYQ